MLSVGIQKPDGGAEALSGRLQRQPSAAGNTTLAPTDGTTAPTTATTTPPPTEWENGITWPALPSLPSAVVPEKSSGGTVLTEMLSPGSDFVDGVDVKNKFSGEIRHIPVSGLFVAIGQMPQNDSFSGLVKLDGSGYIVANEDCRTNVEGIFTAGDCRTKTVRQLTTAASDGATAALAACEYLG